MQFANPIWLWGLTGLLIPIGIHLLSRKEGKVIKIGSLRHLEESHTKQSINVRLNEVTLLILRCILISLIVLLLSGLTFDFLQSTTRHWIVVENGLEQDREFKPLIDSLIEKGFEVKGMKKGFPDLTESKAPPFVSYWEMVEDLKDESIDKGVVFSFNLARNFRGQRLAMPNNVTWISKDPDKNEYVLNAIKRPNDSVYVRMGYSSPSVTTYSTITDRISPDKSFIVSPSGDSVKVEPPDTLRIVIYADDEFEYDKKIMIASLRAIESTIPVIVDLSFSTPQSGPEPDWIISLSGNVPENVKTNSFILREDGSGRSPLLKKMNDNSLHSKWIITQRLNEEVALEEKLTLKLASILSSKQKDEARAKAMDRMAQPENFLWSDQMETGSTHVSFNADDNRSWSYLALLIVAGLLAERLLAFKRNA